MPSLVDEIRQQIQSRYCRPEAVTQRIPTERDLVTQLGVSRATVRKAMRELELHGYLVRYQGRGTFVADPGPQANRLPGRPKPPAKAPKTLAVIGHGNLNRMANAQTFTALLDQASHHGLGALASFTHGDPVREVELLQQALDHGVDGILLQPCFATFASPTLVRRIELMRLGRDVPMVILGQSEVYPQAHSVWFDEEQAGYLATRHLIDQGHRRIAMIQSNLGLGWRNRAVGFRRAMAEAGLAVPEDYQIDINELPRPEPTLKLARMAGRLLLSLDQPPTAVFAYWSEIAAGMMLEALDRGLRVPEDLALAGVGIHLLEETQKLVPMDVTTVWHDSAKLAEHAVDVLHAQIHGRELPAHPAPQPELRVAASSAGSAVHDGAPSLKAHAGAKSRS